MWHLIEKQGLLMYFFLRISATIECKMENNWTNHVPTICSRREPDGLLIATTEKSRML